MNTDLRIPLFPLGVVLLPNVPLPLHIFEERYKVMIGECVEENREFGVVFFDGGEISRVGCTAQIVEILKQYESGEMDIVTIGRKRFATKAIHDEKPYLEADVVYFDDQAEADSEALTALVKQGREALAALGRMTGEEATDPFPENPDAKAVSFLIAGIEGFNVKEKQRLLEMTSTRHRLESGIASLRKVLQRVSLTKEIESLIGGNGNIRRILKEKGIG